METTSKHHAIYGGTGQVSRRIRNSERQTKTSTKGNVTPDFLRHNFLPLCKPNASKLPTKEDAEKTYFQSLEKLCDFYGLVLTDKCSKTYPANILLTHWEAAQKLRKINPDLSLDIVKQNGQVVLATRDIFNTNMKLFYIPVQPLFLLLKNQKGNHKKAAALLLSVFSYLYHHSGIAYYRAEDSFVRWQYEMIAEWLIEGREDWEKVDFDYNVQSLKAAFCCGDLMEQKIYHPNQLKFFKERLDNFHALGGWEQSCFENAKSFYELWQGFPKGNIYNHLSNDMGITDEGEEDESSDYVIRANQYISFVATTDDWLGDGLINSVSNELNEYSYIDEPTKTLVFDEDFKGDNDSIAYERKLFALIGDLCSLLNEIR